MAPPESPGPYPSAAAVDDEGQVATHSGRAPVWAVATGAVALELSWLWACECWHDAYPGLIIGALVVAWPALVAAWRLRLPRGVASSAALAGGVVALDAGFALAGPSALSSGFFLGDTIYYAAVFAACAAVEAARPSLGRRRPARAFAFVRASSVTALALIGATMAVLAVRGSRDESGPADAALVLGATLRSDGGPGDRMLGRVDHAADVFARGLVPQLVLTGGASRAGHSEAEVMASLLVARGVPRGALLLEGRARSTSENFACSLPVLEAIGARRILVVTEPWHMGRSMLLARRNGYDARQSPASSAVWRSPRRAGYWLSRDALVYLTELARQPFARRGVCDPPDCEGCRKR